MRPLQLKRLSTSVKVKKPQSFRQTAGFLTPQSAFKRPLSNRHPPQLGLLSLSRGNDTTPTQIVAFRLHKRQTQGPKKASQTAYMSEKLCLLRDTSERPRKVSAWWLFSCNLNKRSGLKAVVSRSETSIHDSGTSWIQLLHKALPVLHVWKKFFTKLQNISNNCILVSKPSAAAASQACCKCFNVVLAH